MSKGAYRVVDACRHETITSNGLLFAAGIGTRRRVRVGHNLICDDDGYSELMGNQFGGLDNNNKK